LRCTAWGAQAAFKSAHSRVAQAEVNLKRTLVLASALDGFSPTPEFPEIAEAQTLLIALA
jgi:hypothetical protein